MPAEGTVEDFNAREKLRASIVARLHGYTPWETGDTEEALKAEYEALTGEAYRSREEEQAANRGGMPRNGDNSGLKRNWTPTARSSRTPRPTASSIAAPFVNALGWDKPKPNGFYYSSLQVAYRWIEDAGEEVVYLIPDGRTDVTKSERTGCYPDVFARVLAYKNACLRQARPRRMDWPTWRGGPGSQGAGRRADG